MTEDREVKHLRELVELKADSLRIALELQAKEYERRLTDLNHAHARSADAAQRSVSREAYDSDKEAFIAANNSLIREIEIIRREVSVDLARRTGRVEMLAVFAMVFSLLSPLVIKLFFS